MADVVEKTVAEENASKPVEGAAADAEPSAKADEEVHAESASVEEKITKNVSNGTTTELDKKIIRQVEYYFGDANLARDKFLTEQIAKNDDSWVPLSVLLTFKRLAALSQEVEVIVNALLKSDEGLLEISEDREKIRRHPERPIPIFDEVRKQEIQSRTAYAKGFPLTIQMSELIEFFTPFDKVVNIQMRKYLDKPTKTYKFKGSVFITFDNPEQMKNFVDKEKVAYNDERELLRKTQKAYFEEKKNEYAKKQNRKKGQNKVQKEEEKSIELPKGTVISFADVPEGVARETLREAIEKVEGDFEVAYVDFNKGATSGYIRLQNENAAAQLLEKLEDKKLKLTDSELVLRLLTEEEEKTYLDKVVEQMKERRRKFRSGGNRNGKRKYGGKDNKFHSKVRKVE